MTDTSKMTDREFADWIWESDEKDYEPFVTARDAYHAQVTREACIAAIRRVRMGIQHGALTNMADACINAICALGKPAFVPGQLVREKKRGAMLEAWMGYDEVAVDYEAVHAHIDDAGRVIIDEEAPK